MKKLNNLEKFRYLFLGNFYTDGFGIFEKVKGSYKLVPRLYDNKKKDSFWLVEGKRLYITDFQKVLTEVLND